MKLWGTANDNKIAMLVKNEANRQSGSGDMAVVRWQQQILCILHELHYWSEFLRLNYHI